MDFYSIAKQYYPKHYDESKLKVFVVARKITPEQYEKITGDPYEPAE